jgi:rsbT co-antagonist protein RsbR
MTRELSRKLRIDANELRARREFFQLRDEDLQRLASYRGLAVEHTQDIVENFYQLLLGHAETRRFFPDDATLKRVKKLQSDYFLALFAGRCDEDYVEDRLRVGAAHERIGMDTKWYLGAYRRYLELLRDKLFGVIEDPAAAEAAYLSALRLVFFDMSLAIETYIASHADAIRRHQAAIRELSTPVISVYEGVLLLPIVGTVDSRRAEQIMEAVLTRVSTEQARVLILDIAGVAVVDTEVADHLLKTTAAAKLLGADVVLTGITPEVARTVVQLGVDISSMHTKSRLADGIQLALAMLGKAIHQKDG